MGTPTKKLLAVGLAAAMSLAACSGSDEPEAVDDSTETETDGGSSSDGAANDSDDAAVETETETDDAAGDEMAAGSCGANPERPPSDPNGLLDALSDEQRAAYNGYGEVRASAWSDWEAGDGPYQVGIVFTEASSEFQAATLAAITTGLEANPNVSEVQTAVTGFDPTGQVSAYNQLVDAGMDIMIVQPLVAESFIAAFAQAGERNVPTISLLNTTPSEFAINVASNNYQASADTASALVTALGGSGSVLQVHAIPGNPVDVQAFTAYEDVFAQCPDIEVVGEITGNFDPAEAKAETLKFISTFPSPIDGVVQTASMASGVISAFEEAGRDVPIVTDTGDKASLGYWAANADSYTGTSTVLGAEHLGSAAVRVVNRLIDGERPVMADMITQLPVVTADNLDEWADPSWTLDTPGAAEGTGDYFLPDSELDAFFTS